MSLATNVENTLVRWIETQNVHAVRRLVFFWQLRSCLKLGEAISEDQGWLEFGYFSTFRFILTYGVFAKFQDETTNEAAKKDYESRKVNRRLKSYRTRVGFTHPTHTGKADPGNWQIPFRLAPLRGLS